MKKFVVLSFVLGLGSLSLHAAENDAAEAEGNAQNLRFAQENKDIRKDASAESSASNKGASADNAAGAR